MSTPKGPNEVASYDALTPHDALSELLQQTEAARLQLEQILERISDAFVALDANWRYTYMNERAGVIFNREPKEMIGKHIWTEFPEGVGQVFYDNYYAAMETQTPRFIEEYYPPYDRWFENRIYPSPEGLSIFFQDVTERKRHAAKLERLNLAYKALTACNHALIRATDEAALLADICRICVRIGGRRLVWVGYAEHDDRQSVRPVARDGAEQEFLDTADIRWSDTERGRGPTGTAIRTGCTVILRNVLDDQDIAPWRDTAQRLGLGAAISLPLFLGEEVLGALTIYETQPDAYSADETALLEGLARNLEFGIGVLRGR